MNFASYELILALLLLILLIKSARMVSCELMGIITKVLPFRALRRFVYAILVLPGTLIHELSHLLVAKFLFVKVYGFSIFPVEIDGGITLGQVVIAKTDVVRGTLIGFAPVAFGLSLIALGGKYLSIPTQVDIQLFFYVYGLLQLSNVLLLSKSDTKSFFRFLVVTMLTLALIFWLAKPAFFEILDTIVPSGNLIARNLLPFLGLSLGVNVLLLITILILKRLPQFIMRY